MGEHSQNYTIDTATGAVAPAQTSADRTHAIFSHIAQRYDRFNALTSFGTHKLWLRALVQSCPVHANSKVLDVAGGTGAVSFALAQAKHPASIDCTDLVPEMLEVARHRAQTHNFEDTILTFREVDAQAIPYEDASFDCVTMAYGIRNIPGRIQALNEIYRVLKPGGAFSCLEFSHPLNPLWAALYYRYLDHVMPALGSLICHERAGFVYLNQSIRAFPPQKEFAQLLESCQFENVTWQNLSGGIAAIHTAQKPIKDPLSPQNACVSYGNGK